MEIAAHVDALERDGALLADAADAAGLTASVPTCPGWQVRDLVRHQAYVHAWAARHVTGQPSTALDEDDEEAVLAGGPDDAALIDAYRSGHAALVAALRAAAPAPGDAFGTAFADDGIDELIMGFAARRRYRLRADGTRSLTVRATDTGNGWQVRLADGATTVARRDDTGDADGGPGDCLLAGPAADIYAYLWNRSDPAAAAVTITGDPVVLDVWRSSVRVTW